MSEDLAPLLAQLDELGKAWGVRSSALRCTVNGPSDAAELAVRQAQGEAIARCLAELKAVLVLAGLDRVP